MWRAANSVFWPESLTKTAFGFSTRGFRRIAASNQFAHAFLEMKRDLFVHIRSRILPAAQPEEFANTGSDHGCNARSWVSVAA